MDYYDYILDDDIGYQTSKIELNLSAFQALVNSSVRSQRMAIGGKTSSDIVSATLSDVK